MVHCIDWTLFNAFSSLDREINCQIHLWLQWMVLPKLTFGIGAFKFWRDPYRSNMRCEILLIFFAHVISQRCSPKMSKYLISTVIHIAHSTSFSAATTAWNNETHDCLWMMRIILKFARLSLDGTPFLLLKSVAVFRSRKPLWADNAFLMPVLPFPPSSKKQVESAETSLIVGLYWCQDIFANFRNI